MIRNYVIYRAWEGPTLLYLGLTINPGSRFAAHCNESAWWDRVTHLTFQHLSPATDRRTALAIELQSINDEAPVYNIVGHPRPQRHLRRRCCEHSTKSQTSEPAGVLADLRQLRESTREEVRRLDDELPSLVKLSFEQGRTWQEIAEAVGVKSKQRVYQLLAKAR